MKTRTLNHLLVLLTVVVGTSLATGCVVHTHSPAVVETAVVSTPPTRVYYEGRYLHYRTDGYYYYTANRWVPASAVPVHVARYHQPTYVVSAPVVAARPVHVTRSTTTVVRSAPTRVTRVEATRSPTTRPAPSRTVTTRSTGSRPVHVSR